MEYQVKLTAPAEADVAATYEYIRAAAPEAAEKWLRGLFDVILSLGEMPASYPLIAEAEEIRQPIRQRLYGKRTGTYRIIYDIQEQMPEGPTVRILRVWHAMRDIIKAADIESS